MINTFFADTYALIEILNGHPDYTPYAGEKLLTTQYNLIELYYHAMQTWGNEAADLQLKMLSKLCIKITHTSINYAMKFKLQYKKEKLSYVDCIGYSLAQELKIPFLTGESKFKDKENVEWIK